MPPRLNTYEDKLKQDSLPPEVAEIAKVRVAALRAAAPDSIERVDTDFYLTELLKVPWEPAPETAVDFARLPEALDMGVFGPTTIPEVLAGFLTEIFHRRDPIPADWPTPVFFGPSGIGKRTLAGKIAVALGRPLQVLQLQFSENDSDLYGVSSDRVRGRPGRIAEALQAAGRPDPVIVLAGLDWPVRNWQDHGASLIRLLFDPDARRRFRDRFLDVEMDLSRALFIATAGVTDAIPPEAFHRTLAVDWAGYTRARKLDIATTALLPRILERHAMPVEEFQILDSAIEVLIKDYAIEPGVEDLERLLDFLCHKVAVALALGKPAPKPIGPEAVQELLGLPRTYGRDAGAPPRPGVAKAIVDSLDGAWVEPVEAVQVPGTEGFGVSGSAGESLMRVVDTAYHYLRSRMTEMDISARQLYEYGYRLNFRFDERGEDPSVGLAVVVALISQLRDRFVDPELALTGEITLNGRVLGAPGLHHKLLAAHRYGIHRIILSRENRNDLDDLPDDLKNEMSVVEVEEADHAIRVSLQ